MTTAACYILHYGREWLMWSLRSVMDFVDDAYIFYTPTPSHGHSTAMVNPESRDELFDIANLMDAIWIDCPRHFAHEGEHRTFAVETLKQRGFDTVVVVDADEVWDQEVMAQALRAAKEDTTARSFRIGMRHFWRSLKWVCDDPAMPTRIIKPSMPLDAPEAYLPGYVGKVFHMGYAQSAEIIQYKQSIHGHKNEWRPGWFENIFMDWIPGRGDVHPTCIDYWNPVKYEDDPSHTLEHLVGDHPYYAMEIIP